MAGGSQVIVGQSARRGRLCPPDKGFTLKGFTLKGTTGGSMFPHAGFTDETLPGPPFLRIFDIREGTGGWLTG